MTGPDEGGGDSGGGREPEWPGALDEHRPATEGDRWAVPATQQLSATLVRALGLDGAAVAMIGDTGERDLVHATDPVIALLDELQFTLAEGPCLDAYSSVAPVLVDDLREEGCRTRWPVFAQEAYAAGAVAVFAFPMVTGAVCFGVLELYRRTPGPLAAQAQRTAGDAVEALTKVALTELLGPETDLESSWPARLTVEHAEVHQAAGMVAVHLGTSVPDAMARLRATAYTQSTSLTELAHRVLTGQTRLDKDTSA